ncbi:MULTISPECIES: recombinase family protein [Eubacterium]|jgi:DNA invertase Pin-like site-specific DNA recombinase|uniref:recombinase family protein n=1 Tax=Eubacterium TaxID=1730 RepID=UPI000E474DEE|nr:MULTISPECIES: recombinase family protein [Eubacterium]RGG67613.1 recombinase family protein [Eubacterium sp. AF17-7]RHB18929.1 recombinase family protein [Eubacterium ventriosum]
MKKYGYVRVSTREQNLERQILAMKEEGIEDKNIYADQMSGKDFDRPKYNRLMKKLKPGDLLVIKSIDRLGRNYTEILEQWRVITKNKKANIKVIDMPLLNTETGHGDLTGVFISDLVLQILAYVAETERAFIKQRQAEGIAIAKKNGVKFGREKLDLPRNFEEYHRLWKDKKISVREAAKAVGMSTSTFYRRCREKEENSG